MEKINVSYLEEVCGGDKEIITEMVNIFRDQIPEFIEGMRSHYEKEEFPELGLLAHKAKYCHYGDGRSCLKAKDLN
ncbi:MAG: Hpt domain-containing protein [Bacteroidales bacterium]